MDDVNRAAVGGVSPGRKSRKLSRITIVLKTLLRYDNGMSKAATRTYPKSRYSDAEIAAYMASEEGKIAKWLSFESDHLNMLREQKELGVDW